MGSRARRGARVRSVAGDAGRSVLPPWDAVRTEGPIPGMRAPAGLGLAIERERGDVTTEARGRVARMAIP